jgi:hypothetical protein
MVYLKIRLSAALKTIAESECLYLTQTIGRRLNLYFLMDLSASCL